MNLEVAARLARSLMDKHGLAKWTFRFDGRRRAAGTCRPGLVTLSRYFVELNSEEDVRDFVLHEIAHSLVGPERQHDEVWKAKAREIGADPSATRHNLNRPDGRLQAVCGK